MDDCRGMGVNDHRRCSLVTRRVETVVALALITLVAAVATDTAVTSAAPTHLRFGTTTSHVKPVASTPLASTSATSKLGAPATTGLPSVEYAHDQGGTLTRPS